MLQACWPINHKQPIDVYMRNNFHQFKAYILRYHIIKQNKKFPSLVQQEDGPPAPKKSRSSGKKKGLQWNALALSAPAYKEDLFWHIVHNRAMIWHLLPELKEIFNKHRDVIVVGNGKCVVSASLDGSVRAFDLVRWDDPASSQHV